MELILAVGGQLEVSDVLSFLSTVIISTLVSVLVVRHQLRSAERSSLDRQVDDLLRIALEYPQLEEPGFCERASNDNTDKLERVRYETYCCAVFNLIFRAWNHCKRNKAKTDEVIHASELIVRHKDWWRRDPENRAAYGDKFCRFVNGYLS